MRARGAKRAGLGTRGNAGCTTDGEDEGCMALFGGYGRAIFAYFDGKMENASHTYMDAAKAKMDSDWRRESLKRWRGCRGGVRRYLWCQSQIGTFGLW